jgi:hypothetical protein
VVGERDRNAGSLAEIEARLHALNPELAGSGAGRECDIIALGNSREP